MRYLAGASCYVVPLGIALCARSDELVIDDSCFVDLAPILVRTSVVRVGDTLTLEADLGPADCLPAGITTEEWRWRSSDSLIVRIDSLSGVAEGVSPGEALISVRHAEDAAVSSVIALQVVGGSD